jgi:EAL and modified HD-GYP domain-containing signal transduction protein
MPPTTADPNLAPQLFVARQPIFSADRQVVGYELLFRSSAVNVFPVGVDPDKASIDIIGQALNVFGIDALVGATGQAYVNVTRRVMVEGLYDCLPPGRFVLELLETLRPDEETLAACGTAKDAGYGLALDDFVGQPELAQFLPQIDVLKVDFRVAQPEQRKAIAELHAKEGLTLLAEKVENEADFTTACTLGYTQFQGFFFCRPEMVSRRDIPMTKLVHMQFLSELNRAELDFVRIEQVIKQDVGLSVKLLRYLKAAAFGWRSEITSIRHALSLLGERAFRRWASVLVMGELATDRPAELLTTCLVRARFGELLANEVGFSGRELDLYLVGLFSLMDAVVQRPLEELLRDVALPRDLTEALLPSDKPSRMRSSLQLVLAYERAEWNEVDRLWSSLSRSSNSAALPGMYQSAVTWATATARGDG